MEHSLESRLADSLRFAAEHIARLDDYATHWRGSEADTGGMIRLEDKIVTEAALLLLLARRSEAGATHAAIAALAEAIAPRIRSARLAELLVRHPQTAATLGAGHWFLAAAGWPCARFDVLVGSALDAGFGETVERVNYRLLDQIWTRGLTGRRSVPCDRLLGGSILASRAHPFYMSEADAYAVTHAIMYLTDFGQAALPGALDADKVAAMVEAGIARHLISDDFDLLVEYLICAECLGRGGAPAALLGWHVVDRIWRAHELVPGPTFDPKAFAKLRGEAAAAYAFEHMYHTNFVAGMYLAVRIGWPRETPRISIGMIEDVSRIEALLAVLLAIGGTRCTERSPWFVALDDAPVSDAALGAILWDAAAIEAVRRDDARAMATLAAMPGKPESTTARELDWLMARIARFEGAPVEVISREEPMLLQAS